MRDRESAPVDCQKPGNGAGTGPVRAAVGTPPRLDHGSTVLTLPHRGSHCRNAVSTVRPVCGIVKATGSTPGSGPARAAVRARWAKRAPCPRGSPRGGAGESVRCGLSARFGTWCGTLADGGEGAAPFVGPGEGRPRVHHAPTPCGRAHARGRRPAARGRAGRLVPVRAGPPRVRTGRRSPAPGAWTTAAPARRRRRRGRPRRPAARSRRRVGGRGRASPMTRCGGRPSPTGGPWGR